MTLNRGRGTFVDYIVKVLKKFPDWAGAGAKELSALRKFQASTLVGDDC